MYGSFNPPQGPAKSAQRKDLLLLFFAQDIHRRRIILRLSQCPGSAISLAAFQVSTDGGFWVSAEASSAPHLFLDALVTVDGSLECDELVSPTVPKNRLAPMVAEHRQIRV